MAKPGFMPTEYPPIHLEQALWSENKLVVAGIDEAGRGALAGPIVAAMVILPANTSIEQTLYGVKDSKVMRPSQRDAWVDRIKERSIYWAVGMVSAEEIDEIGIQAANQKAMAQAIRTYPNQIDHHLFDFVFWKNCPFEGQRIKRGESASLSIAAASIIAKTTRDRIMVDLSADFPSYQWQQNKGYGTASHIRAIQTEGYSPYHRRSFILK